MNSILRFSTPRFSIFFVRSAHVSTTNAQGCDNLFISEYIEGWGNNKAIESTTPPIGAIDLSDYRHGALGEWVSLSAENQKCNSGCVAAE